LAGQNEKAQFVLSESRRLVAESQDLQKEAEEFLLKAFGSRDKLVDALSHQIDLRTSIYDVHGELRAERGG